MRFISREEQAKRRPQWKVLGVAGVAPDDAIFDTEELTATPRAVHWVEETKVHRALEITADLRDTNQFVGRSTMIVRDEVRETTHLLSHERSGLYRTAIRNGQVSKRTLLAGGKVRRSHLELRKFDGHPISAYVVQLIDEGYRLYIDGQEIDTESADVDFPFLSIAQPPIGWTALEKPSAGLMTYKCRTTGRLFFRAIDPNDLSVGPEQLLTSDSVVGGADIAFGKAGCTIRYERWSNGRLEVVLRDFAGDAPGIERVVDLTGTALADARILPSTGRLVVDHTGELHVSLTVVGSDDQMHLVDVLPGDDMIVDAIDGERIVYGSAIAFPKMPSIVGSYRLGFGDGDTDGNGIIASVLEAGRLYASNSQSGGARYPGKVLLNHDMQRMYCFKQSECYTRGVRANFVSMDYAFVEADDVEAAVGTSLWLDTWDMPLPQPIVTYEFDGTLLRIEIEKDAWFFPGQSKFEIEPAVAEITEARFIDYRCMELRFNTPARIVGARITFETKNVFYFHRASIDIHGRTQNGPLSVREPRIF